MDGGRVRALVEKVLPAIESALPRWAVPQVLDLAQVPVEQSLPSGLQVAEATADTRIFCTALIHMFQHGSLVEPLTEAAELHGPDEMSAVPRLPRLHPRSLRIHQKHRFCEIVYRKEGQVDVRAAPLQISDQLRATLGAVIDKSLIDSVVELMT